MTKGKLYLIPTVISDNTQNHVISERVKEVIKEVDCFLVENMRTARRYISSLKLGVEIESLRFEVLDKKSTLEQLKEMMLPVFEGKSIGVISESGCPGVADPGALAVEFAHKNDIQVVPLVGPSSILMTLMASGFNGQSFAFHGYLPIDKALRKAKIEKLENDAYRQDQTQLFMDTPYRNIHLFEDLLKHCKSETKICVARDVTGAKEYISTKTVKEWKGSDLPDLHKIPVVFGMYT